MMTERLEEAERAVFHILQTSQQPIPLKDETTVREAIWSLVDRRKVRFTQDRSGLVTAQEDLFART
jgi:hypothetical protein